MEDRIEKLEQELEPEGELNVVVVHDKTVRGPDDMAVRLPAVAPPLSECEVVADHGSHKVWRPIEKDHGVLGAGEVTK